MRYVSLFSGIEAATVAWQDFEEFDPVAFCEIDKFPSAVLAYRFPEVPNLGDITKVDWKEVMAEHGAIDLVVGGSPCQSFSIAGGRESLDGESRLMFEYIRAVSEIRPTWFLWENVPGVLSTRDNAFGQLLAEMEKLGYGMAWRTLDAQFFGVAQRRRRVFLVGCLGNGAASAAVLFEPESVSGNTQSSKQKREELTRAVEERAGIGGFKFHQGADAGSIDYVDEQSPTLTSDWHQPGCLTPWDCESKRIYDQNGIAPTLPSGTNEGRNIQPAVMAFDTTQITNPDNNAHPEFGKPCHTISAKAHVPTICLQTDHMGQNGGNTSVDICKTLDCASQTPVVCMQTNDDIASSLTARYDSSPCADRGQNVICMSDTQARSSISDIPNVTAHSMKDPPVICISDDQAHSAIDVDMSGSLKVGGGAP